MTQAKYTTSYNNGMVVVQITFPDGHTIKHSIPKTVLENKKEPQKGLESIIKRRARNETWPEEKPNWLVDSGGVKF